MQSTRYNKLNFKYLTIAFALLFNIFSYSAAFANPEHPATATEHNTANEHNATAEHPEGADAEHHDAAAPHHGEEKFNPGEMILEHIGDAHEWHVFTYNHHHYSIPLPVIVYSAEGGLKIFSSSKFHENKVVEGYQLNHKSKLEAVNADGTVNEEAKFYDLSITKNVVTLFVSLLIMCFLFISVARMYTRNPGKAPRGIQAGVEMMVLFIRDEVAKPSIGPKYAKYMPYLLMIFFFIWINNLMGLIPIAPFGANLTGNIAVTLTLALLTFVITLASSNKYFWQHIFAMPGVPKPVLIILVPIEIMGLFLKPIVLTLRLFANITAGHIIGLAFFSLIFIFGAINQYIGLGVSFVSVPFTIFMTFMELLVAFLQAYVFTLLSAIYIGGAVEEHHHEEHDHAHAH